MKIYIATGLENYKIHNEVRDKLLSLGHKITYDWTIHGSVKNTSYDRIREVAISEAKGVTSADLIIVLLPGGRGTHSELGIAIGSNIKIIIWSEVNKPFLLTEDTCAFYHHPLVSLISLPLTDFLNHLSESRL